MASHVRASVFECGCLGRSLARRVLRARECRNGHASARNAPVMVMSADVLAVAASAGARPLASNARQLTLAPDGGAALWVIAARSALKSSCALAIRGAFLPVVLKANRVQPVPEQR
jgi:hypothetical protein